MLNNTSDGQTQMITRLDKATQRLEDLYKDVTGTTTEITALRTRLGDVETKLGNMESGQHITDNTHNPTGTTFRKNLLELRGFQRATEDVSLVSRATAD